MILRLLLLHVLLLLDVALFHLLGLLLMPLLHLLFLSLVCALLLGSLVLRFLFLLELLMLLVLFCDQLVLLLLIFLIEFGVSGIGRRWRLVGLHLAGMGKVGGASVWCWTIGWMIGRSCFMSRDYALAAKLCGTGGCSDWGLALID